MSYLSVNDMKYTINNRSSLKIHIKYGYRVIGVICPYIFHLFICQPKATKMHLEEYGPNNCIIIVRGFKLKYFWHNHRGVTFLYSSIAESCLENFWCQGMKRRTSDLVTRAASEIGRTTSFVKVGGFR